MKILLTVSILLFAIFDFLSATQVSGDVWGSWSADNNPYEVIGNIRVPCESTLVIGPGCYVEFQPWLSLIIDTLATLRATGSLIDSIYFTSPYPSNWSGILFRNVDSTTVMAYCVIEKARQSPSGGGISIVGSNLRINNCIIRNNLNIFMGGGIAMRHSNVVIDGSSIIGNNTGMYGGGIYCDSSIITVTDCVISNNETRSTTGILGFGGGIYCINSQVIIDSNNISNNFCWSQGGGICLHHCFGSVTNNTIAHNISRRWGAEYLSGMNRKSRYRIISFKATQETELPMKPTAAVYIFIMITPA